MIRLVTLDFWQTLFADLPENLVRNHALRLEGVGEALGRTGYTVGPAALEAAEVRCRESLQAIWATHRDVTPAGQVRLFLAALDQDFPGRLSDDALRAIELAYAAPVLTHAPPVTPGAVVAIRALRAQGMLLAVISNTGRTPGTMLRRLLERAGVLDSFAVLSFSDELGVRKPDEAIFARTLAEADCSPAAAVHVGDDPVTDVGGARGAGMHAVHYAAADNPAAAAADGILRDFADLPALVARLAGG